MAKNISLIPQRLKDVRASILTLIFEGSPTFNNKGSTSDACRDMALANYVRNERQPWTGRRRCLQRSKQYLGQSCPQRFGSPSRLSIGYAYELPLAKAGTFARQAFQGWGFSGLLTLQSGQPFTVGDSFTGGAYGFSGGTPSAVCGSNQITALPGDAPLATCTPGQATNPLAAPTSGPIQRRLDDYINPNFFSHPAPVPFAGDSLSNGFGSPGMRNIYRGPFQESVDFSIMKNFHLGERHRIQFRTDFFNLFNHPVFSIPTCTTCLDLNVSVANFSKITQTVIPARLIQFGLKYSY